MNERRKEDPPSLGRSLSVVVSLLSHTLHVSAMTADSI